MSYIALARFWRPKKFAELLGQIPVTTVLTRSLTHQRLHHAYLFTGTRGVGKTSVARLFAKALNCQTGITAEPCLQCASCISIEQGNFVDLIEIDAASKTRVEDTRELLDNVIYAPSIGRFKIYLIDEVHMLSNHSFNALLKTLEEPPEYVKFLLATTDQHKLPSTVLSRCLQLHLKPIASSVIEQHLMHILTTDGYTYEMSAINLLAHAAGGSLRDALSLLETALASVDAHLDTAIVKQLLGITEYDYALLILQAIAHAEPEKIITITQQIAQDGNEFRYVLETILTHLHNISLRQIIPHYAHTTDESLQELSSLWSPEDVQLFYQIALCGLEDLSLAPSVAMGFEMTLLRMCAFRPVITSSVIASPVIATPEIDNHVRAISTIENNAPDWLTIIAQLNLTGIAATAIEQADFVEKTSSNDVILRINRAHQSLYTKSVHSRIEQALSNYYQEPIKLIIKQSDATFVSPMQYKSQQNLKQRQTAIDSLYTDPVLKQLIQDFDGELVQNSIEAIKNEL